MTFICGVVVGFLISCASIYITKLFNKEEKLTDPLSGKKYTVSIESGKLWQTANVEFALLEEEDNEV